jgi:alkanesulfonate monooxygenase SsuD/methylene tetrahydromethanopterin reductase-like flavin-dependent oxidoreductase (luciferase family)
MERGYGVSALINPDLIGPLANAAEAAGYQTFWVNDVPNGNGLERLSRAQQVTSRIRLGVGVLPVDRWNAQAIAEEIARLNLDADRLVVGIGAGTLHKGSLDATADVASDLISRVRARVLIGALGPKMCRLAGSGAHGVLLNWLTPGAAEELALLTKEGAAAVGRPVPEIVGYVRTAADPAAQSRLEKEATAYEGYPSYARHFERMGVRAIDTTVNGSGSEIDRRFQAYASSTDEVVARAIAASDSLDDYLAVLRAASPAAGA